MPAALHSQCTRIVCVRIPFANRPLKIVTPFHASPFHVGSTLSLARNNGTPGSQETVSTLPKDELKKKGTVTVNKTYVPWSKDELGRLTYLYSDGKNPTPRSIMSLFPCRSHSAIYNKVYKIIDRDRRQPWSPADRARLLEMHNAGTEALEISTHFPDRAQGAVMQQLSSILPDSYFSDRKRMVSSSVLGKEGQVSGGKRSCDVDKGAIVTATKIRKGMTFWTDEEDAVLRSLVQKAKERNPDRWTSELSQLLNDPSETVGLARMRSWNRCIQRWKRLEDQPFVSKTAWTESEDHLLMKSVYSRLGIQLNLTTNPQSSIRRKDDDKEGSLQKEQPTTAQTGYKEKMQWPKIRTDQLKTVNWHQVALDVGTRDSRACLRRFVAHFKLKKCQNWTAMETNRLKEGLRKYGRDWEKVASVVGTRTANQANTRYRYLAR